jgi:hypothetical protein
MKDYTELAKALTCGNDGKLPCHNNECPYWVDQWHGIGLCNVIKKDADAASAIEALQAELEKKRTADCWGCKCEKLEPKRGEWIVKGANRIDCSVCGHSVCFAFGLSDGSFYLYKYCPECGAKMEVQE